MAAAAAITVIRNIRPRYSFSSMPWRGDFVCNFCCCCRCCLHFSIFICYCVGDTREEKNEHQIGKERKKEKEKPPERENEIAYFGRRRCIDSHFSSFPKPIDEQRFAEYTHAVGGYVLHINWIESAELGECMWKLWKCRWWGGTYCVDPCLRKCWHFRCHFHFSIFRPLTNGKNAAAWEQKLYSQHRHRRLNVRSNDTRQTKTN